MYKYKDVSIYLPCKVLQLMYNHMVLIKYFKKYNFLLLLLYVISLSYLKKSYK